MPTAARNTHITKNCGHAALAAVRLIGELGAAQLHHTEQVGDIALVLPDLVYNIWSDCRHRTACLRGTNRISFRD